MMAEAAGRALLATPLGPPTPTPWGPAVAVILCLLPIGFLVVVTVVRRLLLPTNISLPVAAGMLAFIRLAYLSSPPLLVCAACLSGLLEALTPLSIITGAIMLFQTMHHTKCLPWMMAQIKTLSAGHPVAEVMLIGWAFAYLVEGASGFGTPVALAAPLLASLGHDPLLSVVCLLIMNTLATQFGAVGTPIWFGLGGIGLGQDNLQLVGLKVAIIIGACAFVITPLAASFLTPLRVLARNGIFVVLSILTAVGPSVAIATFSYEFPSLIGGIFSVLLTGLLTKFKIGLRPVAPAAAAAAAAHAAPSVSVGSTPWLVGRSGASAARSAPSVLRSRRSHAAPSHSFSFIEGVGVVQHPPASTLDFPLSNDPQAYPQCQRRSFAAQVDEAALLSAAVAAAAGPAGDGKNGVDAPAAAAASSQDAKLVKDIEARGGHLPSATGSAPSILLKAPRDFMHLEHPAAAAAADAASGEAVAGGSSGVDGEPAKGSAGRPQLVELLLRTLPLTLTVLLLLLTRIPALPIKRALQSPTPRFLWRLGTLGNFGISASLVVQLQDILMAHGPAVSWKYEALYVPFILPFALASAITLLVHRRDLEVHWSTPFKEAFHRVGGITVATLGALVLVQLIRIGDAGSPAYIIGFYLSAALGKGFLAISAFLGVLGSFFSGSTTVSNLTFGDINKVAAERIGVSITGMLAVQVAGATIGNCVCINNCLSAKAVMNMTHVPEGDFIRRTAPIALLFVVLAEAIGLMFTLGGVLPDHPVVNVF